MASVALKVGQLLIAAFAGIDDAKQMIDEVNIGGVVYLRNMNDALGQEESKELQSYSPNKLLIMVDQEGGRVSYFWDDVPQSPGNGVLGTYTPEYTKQLAYQVALGLREKGVNCNLAPVVDINSNPNNPIIGVRSFGSDPEQVALFGKAALTGYLEGEVIPCLKHFPGHGETTTDSHYELPVVDKSLDELLGCELVPYYSLVKHTPMIMTAHVLYPQIDPINPATLSKTILQGILREKLGYEGVIITDSLTMKGALVDTIEEVAIRAIEAGADLLILGDGNTPKQTRSIHRAIVEAVAEGRISEERIDASLQRITGLLRRNDPS